MGKVIPMAGGGGADLDVITAGAGDVLNGKVIVDREGNPLTGTMPNRGNVSQALGAGGSYAIPAGYHAGGGKVTANSLASQTSANAGSGQILTGYNAWVNGSKITGNMVNRGAVSQSLGINGSYTIPAGYHNGSGKVTQSIATMGGQTITPSTAQQTVSCSGKYMTGNVAINPVRYFQISGSSIGGKNIDTFYLADYDFTKTGQAFYIEGSLPDFNYIYSIIIGSMATYMFSWSDKFGRKYIESAIHVNNDPGTTTGNSWIIDGSKAILRKDHFRLPYLVKGNDAIQGFYPKIRVVGS